MRGNPRCSCAATRSRRRGDWIDPIRDAWAQSREPPRPYAAGTWGPNASVALIERDGRTWNEEYE